MNKHSRLLHKVEVVNDEPIPTNVPATETVEKIEPVGELKTFELEGGGEMMGLNIEGSDGNGGKVMWMVAGMLVFLAVGVVGAVVYFSRARMSVPVEDPTGSERQTTPVPTGFAIVTPGVTATPSATPTKVITEKLKVQVLNGSGIKGEAGVAAEVVKKIGLLDVVVGNASRFDFETTQVKYKKNVPAETVKDVFAELEKVYEMNSDEDEVILNSGAFDIQVIVGSGKK